jgi:pilus assembly protein FimV
MNAMRALGAVLLAGAALMCLPGSAAQAQPASSYEVRRGDTLFGVARKVTQDGVTRNQMIVAIYRANQGAFTGGSIHRLEVGTVLTIPSRDEVVKISALEADRQMRDLLEARPAATAPSLAAVKPAPSVTLPAPPSAAAPSSAAAAARRYEEGLSMERRGDHRGAFAAFLEAGEAGNGLAQRRLGQIYDTGSPAVRRDYETALKWYQKARDQGVPIDKPLPRRPPPS